MEFVCQFGVVEAEEFEERCAQIVHVYFIFHYIEIYIVCFSDSGSGFDSSTGDPHGESVGVVIVAIGSAQVWTFELGFRGGGERGGGLAFYTR